MGHAKNPGKEISVERKNALAALRYAGYSQEQCAKILRMGYAQVNALVRKMPPIPEDVEKIKKGLAGKVWNNADRALDAMTDEKLMDSSAAQLSIIAATQIDKGLLLEGKATQIVDYRAINEEMECLDAEYVELQRKIAELEAPVEPMARGSNGQFLPEE